MFLGDELILTEFVSEIWTDTDEDGNVHEIEDGFILGKKKIRLKISELSL